MKDTLAIRMTVREVVHCYEQARAAILGGYQQIQSALDALNGAFTMEHCHEISLRDRHNHLDFSRTDAVLASLRRDVWWTIVERLDIRRMLSIGRAAELDKRLRDGDLPDVTEEAVCAFAQFYLDHISDMIAESVHEVYEYLRPRDRRRHTAGQYKTNSLLEVGPRVVLTCVVEFWGIGPRVYHHESELTALENVFQMLDGRGAVNKRHSSALKEAIEASGPSMRGRTDYFAFRACKNRNLHLEFLRKDLLAAFNRIAGGKRLRPPAAADT